MENRAVYTHFYFEDRTFINGVETKSRLKTNYMSYEKFESDDDIIKQLENAELNGTNGPITYEENKILQWNIFKTPQSVDAGAISIYGSGGDGKSTLMKRMMTELNKQIPGCATIIKFGEPEPDSLPNDVAILYASLHNALQTKKVVLLDSIKDLILKWNGPLTSGGISKSPAGWINGLSSSCARINKSIVLSINPLTQKADAISELKELLISTSTTTIITGDNYDLRNGNLGYVSRNSDGRNEVRLELASVTKDKIGASMIDTQFNI